MVGGVTEGLLLGHATSTPVVVLCSEQDVVDLVRSYLGGHGNRFLSTEASLVLSGLILLNRDSRVRL